MYWRPALSQLDYVLSYPDVGAGSPISLDGGSYHNVYPSYDWGFTAEIGYSLPCSGNDVNLAYTHYDHDHHDDLIDLVAFPTLFDPSRLTETISLPFFRITGAGIPTDGSNALAFSAVFAAEAITVGIDPSDIDLVSACANFEIIDGT